VEAVEVPAGLPLQAQQPAVLVVVAVVVPILVLHNLVRLEHLGKEMRAAAAAQIKQHTEMAAAAAAQVPLDQLLQLAKLEMVALVYHHL
jgi:cell division protein ZapA (FtsZ GTPase activity inhibitor)